MKLTIKRPIEIEAVAIAMELAVRYDEEDMPNDYPHRKGDMWNIIVDVETGAIRDWPTGIEPRDLYMKVCDQGVYSLLDEDGSVIAKLEDGYVPSCIPGEHGDYIDFKIDANGVITNWKSECDADSVRESFEIDDD